MKYKKDLTCVSLQNKVKHTKAFIEIQTTKPGSARTLTGLLTTSDRKIIEVAMRNNNTWREKETGSNCHLQLADKNRLQQSVCRIYVEYRDPVMTDAGSIYDVCHSMAWCVLFRYGFGRTLQSERVPHAASNGTVCPSFGLAGSLSLFLLRRTPCRQSMVSLVGEYLYSPVKPFSGVPDPASIATSQTVKKSLRTCNGVGYVNYAPHKTGAGRGNPCKLKATPDAASVFFVVCYTRHSMAWCAYLMTNSPQAFDHATAHRVAPIMVTLAGLPKGRPVPFSAGISTPVNVTALFERGNSGGDSLTKLKEAA
ncbi:ash family protein [Salmonella enterica]|uniref:ash family protein n=1 Tax=Salmonella enterica TaxID=28901 RepID=UPI0015D07565|nr:ash family protein [Salmonella enterica]